MVRNAKDLTKVVINVFLKDGTSFLGKDISSKPFGDHDRVVSFWEGNVFMVYPLTEVERFELVFLGEE